ncbi:MAG: response regulator, partial [Nitrospiraceae bacterium]|nr:response regulator [Nitrospiraceae bacterium]
GQREMKVLIVDDCRTTRKLLSFYIKAKGFDVATAENGLDAMSKVAQGDINMIITDLNMPFMDGIELIKTLKADPSRAHIPVLMVTTEKDAEEKKRAYDAGVNGFMMKPVSSDDVVKNVKNIMKNIFGEEA